MASLLDSHVQSPILSASALIPDRTQGIAGSLHLQQLSLPTKAHYTAVLSEFLYSSNPPASASRVAEIITTAGLSKILSLFFSAGEESPGLAQPRQALYAETRPQAPSAKE